MKTVKLTNKDVMALIDDEDDFMVSHYNWYGYKDGRTGSIYVRANVPQDDPDYGVYPGNILHLHRFVMGAEQGDSVMFMDRNPLNCQKENLRHATRHDISSHAPGRYRMTKNCPDTQNFKGINFRNFGKKKVYRAQLKDQSGKLHTGPIRDTAAKAAKDYDKIALRINGPLAFLNFPRKNKKTK
jgi:hypothetical protein